MDKTLDDYIEIINDAIDVSTATDIIVTERDNNVLIAKVNGVELKITVEFV